jgi:two-component system CheB/CheR fusion protein
MALPLKNPVAASHLEAASPRPERPGESVSILLVDDQPSNLDVLEAILESPEYRIVRAQSANDALLALLHGDFAAIVLDMKMPDVSGIDLAVMIKQRKRTRDIPIVFLTAHMLEESDVLRGYGVGAVDYLSKPVQPEILKSKIGVFIDLFRKTRALAAANQALEDEVEERQAIQEALRLANAGLEARVEERTADLTRLNECLRESEEYFREVTHGIPHLVWTGFPDGAVDFANRRWSEYTGQTLDPARSFRDVWLAGVHPDDRDRAERAYVEGMRSGKDFSVEARIARADGVHRWHLSHCVPLHDTAGKVRKLLVTGTDIDEQKKAEEALREDDARKNEFIATLAHELRNPLAPIRNGLEIMRLREDDPVVMAQARSMMGRQLSQLVRLVDDLLDISRITGGRIQLRRSCVDLSIVLESALETAKPVIAEAEQEVRLILPGEKTHLDADLTRLSQVFSNLLDNAAKYSDRGGRITIIAEREKDRVVVRVQDTGMGIAKEMLPRVFDMFVQADRRLERGRGGLGIGLTLVKQLVELHGGTVEARSEGTGKGSEFVVRLPVVPSPSSEPLEVKVRHPADSAPGAARRRIVVADDNRDAAESLARMLELDGNEVHIAHDGMEALRLTELLRPDVVILDIGMPRMNGYDVALRIRQQPWSPGILLVALTGWGQEEDRRRAREAGFDRHLTKPVDPVLVQQIVLTRRGGSGSPGHGSK